MVAEVVRGHGRCKHASLLGVLAPGRSCAGAALGRHPSKRPARLWGDLRLTMLLVNPVNRYRVQPLDPESAADKDSAQRYLEFQLGWFADPIYFGDYPPSMRERVGDRLPRFSEQERALVLGSNDFFGLNHYTAK